MSSNSCQMFDYSFDLFSVKVSVMSVVFSYVLIYEWIVFFRQLYTSRRQYKIFENSKLIQVADEKGLRKALNYVIEKTRFRFFASFWRQLLTTIIIWFELVPLLWEYSKSLIQWTGYGSDNEMLQTLVFVVTGSLIITIIDSPLSLYSKFVIQQRYGFNKQTAGLYAIDKIKKFVKMQTIIVPFISGLIWIYQNGNENLFVLLSMVLIFVFNGSIAKHFDGTALPEGDLNQIENINNKFTSFMFWCLYNWYFKRLSCIHCFYSQLFCTAFGFRNIRPVFIGIYLTFRYFLWPIIELMSFLICFLVSKICRRFEMDDIYAEDRNRAEDSILFPLFDWLNSILN